MFRKKILEQSLMGLELLKAAALVVRPNSLLGVGGSGRCGLNAREVWCAW